jgi:hypothetical protein
MLSGAATGALFATRPLAGITIGAVAFAAAITATDARSDRRVTTMAAFALSALPFLLLVGAWNAHFFGSPVRFGYEAALGNAGSLGFGIDPWGNVYGVTHALAYTAAELTTLSLFLLETPIPLVAVIALALALAPRLTRGERLITAWAVLPLAAGLFYWHHGQFMGPRMLADAGPAWAVLAAWGCVTLVARIPDRIPATRFSPRTFVGCALLAAFAAGPLFLGVSRLSSYGSGASQLARTAAAAPARSLVFVHGGWATRVAMRLAATGMRLDSVESALRRNPTCRVQEYADASAGRPTNLERIEVSPGNTMLLAAGETLSPRCRAEAAADRFGVLEVAPILWAGDLPGIETGRPAFVRDLGPHANNRLITQHGREAWALLADPQTGTPRLVRYEEAMDLLWTRMEAK